MAKWIFIVTKSLDGSLSAREIYKQRMQDAFWGLGERTQNRRSLKSGDEVVFYIGNPEIVFGGTAFLASDSLELSNEETASFSHGNEFFEARFGVKLERIVTWDKPRPVKELVDNLEFIENKVHWNTYFQGGIRGVGNSDWEIITGYRTESASVQQQPPQLSAQFALEAHLEDFIDKNWEPIWDGTIRKYSVGDQSGRQFAAGKWSIDFLAIDVQTNDLVVIELKRGRSSDEALGQTLRYIGWVRENIAAPNQSVRGIIIAKEIDDALRTASMVVPFVQVKTYSVNFALL